MFLPVFCFFVVAVFKLINFATIFVKNFNCLRGKFRIMKSQEVIFILIVYQACVVKAIRHLIFQLSDDIFKLYLKQGSKTYIMVIHFVLKSI